ncbi:aldose epimerase family protein [Elstera litoralis]|uniref:aldose epimerase family protein n=1 Tax=Elstera litoralis TaxID=552518 RepID=UPI000696DA9D|nr:hypothetical protein [Elstera litoralis]
MRAAANYQGALAGVPNAASAAEFCRIEAGFLSAQLWPQAGGRIASLCYAPPGRVPRDILVPLTPSPFDPDFWPKGGCYPLVPWSNRIREAQFSFDGQRIALRPHPDCFPHAHHGFAQQRPWHLEAVTPTSAQMRYTHRPDAWPWAFTAVQTVQIAPQGLTIDLAVTNESDRLMPLGLGLHPFLAATAGDEIDFSAKAEWRADSDGLATQRVPLSVETVNQVHGPQGARAILPIGTRLPCCAGRRAARLPLRPARPSIISFCTSRRAGLMPVWSPSATLPMRSISQRKGWRIPASSPSRRGRRSRRPFTSECPDPPDSAIRPFPRHNGPNQKFLKGGNL